MISFWTQRPKRKDISSGRWPLSKIPESSELNFLVNSLTDCCEHSNLSPISSCVQPNIDNRIALARLSSLRLATRSDTKPLTVPSDILREMATSEKFRIEFSGNIISAMIELSRRRDNLTWGHHAEVSSIKQLEIVYPDKTVVTLCNRYPVCLYRTQRPT